MAYKLIKLVHQNKRMKSLAVFISLFFCFTTAYCINFKAPQSGRWIGKLNISSTESINFEFKIEKVKSSFRVIIFNDEEVVPLNDPIFKEDSFHVNFKYFNSELVFKLSSKKSIAGRWINHLKKDYSIPFEATLSNASIFPIEEVTSNNVFDGEWKTRFSPDGNSFEAIGAFKQNGNKITGTFLTETGDFRYLSGNVTNSNKFMMSGYDGSHAFLFIGLLVDGKIQGEYISGNHYRTTWIAEKDSSFKLRHADSLTRMVGNPNEFYLEFNKLNGDKFTFPNPLFQDKVVIIQILGTWCANCMDETIFYKELYDKYNSQGLEIISVGYEIGDEFDDFAKQLETYKKRFNLNHLVLVGGSANKSSAKNDFGFISDFTSFPTSIFIDKTGKVVSIHTGFSGPGTGKYYTEYKEKTQNLIESLLK